ncbi:hypothetical protein RUM43_008287, partial [Polyplax serrata]
VAKKNGFFMKRIMVTTIEWKTGLLGERPNDFEVVLFLRSKSTSLTSLTGKIETIQSIAVRLLFW